MSNKKTFLELTPPLGSSIQELLHFVSIECRSCAGRGMIENLVGRDTCPVCRGSGKLDAVVNVEWRPSIIPVK